MSFLSYASRLIEGIEAYVGVLEWNQGEGTCAILAIVNIGFGD